jgi:hypothetical protein
VTPVQGTLALASRSNPTAFQAVSLPGNTFASGIHVAHALVRAASRLVSTHGRGHRQECRCGTHECVRHLLQASQLRLEASRSNDGCLRELRRVST